MLILLIVMIRILKFWYNTIGFASIGSFWWHGHVTFSIVYFGVFMKHLLMDFYMSFGAFKLFDFINDSI